MPGYSSVPFFVSIIPLAALIILILKMKTPIHLAIIISLVLSWCVAGFYFDNAVQDLAVETLYGAIKGLWPIVIVILGAIFSYNLMLKTGSMEIIKTMLASISDDKRVQVLLISWCFGGFLEAAAGYGTAVAIPIGILVALGFEPLKAAIASLIANTVPTAFGAVGLPVSILAEQTNLPVTELGSAIVIQLSLFNLLLPFVIVCIVGNGLKAIKGVFFITLMCGISTLVPQYFVARYLGAELPAFAGSLVALFVTIFIAKKRKKSAPKDSNPVHPLTLIKAGAIYLLTFIFILLCSPLFPAIKTSVSKLASVIPFALTTGEKLPLTLEWLSTPGMLIIIATLIGGTFQGAKLITLVSTFASTVVQLKHSIVAIMAIVAMATVMDKSGMIQQIAEALVDTTGYGYVFLAPVIGALGTFITGSDTNSNVLFGNLQAQAAERLNIDPTLFAAANTSGATGGKMISPQSIAIAVSATKMGDQSSAIMSGTLKYCAIYIALLSIKIALLYYFFYA